MIEQSVEPPAKRRRLSVEKENVPPVIPVQMPSVSAAEDSQRFSGPCGCTKTYDGASTNVA